MHARRWSVRVEREEKTPHTYMVAICSDFRVLKEEEKKKKFSFFRKFNYWVWIFETKQRGHLITEILQSITSHNPLQSCVLWDGAFRHSASCFSAVTEAFSCSSALTRGDPSPDFLPPPSTRGKLTVWVCEITALQMTKDFQTIYHMVATVS